MTVYGRVPTVNSLPITGASAVTGVPVVSALPVVTGLATFFAWLPSTWPEAPAAWDESLIQTLRKIFEGSMLVEIDNVIADADGDLRHRGHVVAISLLCALDAISSYGYSRKNGRQIPKFVAAHFPAEYRAHGQRILKVYRHAMVHAWNLFGAAVLPGHDAVAYDKRRDVLSLGLLDLRKALSVGLESYLNALKKDAELQKMTLERYTELRSHAKPYRP